MPRQVVRVPDPTVAVRVILMAVGEMSGNPTVDWVADDFAQADGNGESDQDDDAVATTESVGEVVVFTPLRFRQGK